MLWRGRASLCAALHLRTGHQYWSTLACLEVAQFDLLQQMARASWGGMIWLISVCVLPGREHVKKKKQTFRSILVSGRRYMATAHYRRPSRPFFPLEVVISRLRRSDLQLTSVLNVSFPAKGLNATTRFDDTVVSSAVKLQCLEVSEHDLRFVSTLIDANFQSGCGTHSNANQHMNHGQHRITNLAHGNPLPQHRKHPTHVIRNQALFALIGFSVLVRGEHEQERQACLGKECVLQFSMDK
jgi:hypothetical protein